MRFRGAIAVLAFLLMGAASASAQKVNVDYDHSANFAKIQVEGNRSFSGGKNK